jgi:O-antigen/teichoic acid export membrane protein
LATNLLRSADTLIISLSPLGSAAVALYSIPLKLTELQQIPLRSFVATAFPKMSKASLHNQIDEVKKFVLYLFWSTYISLLVLVVYGIALILLNFIVAISGNQYLKTDPITGSMLILSEYLYGLLLLLIRNDWSWFR